VGSGWILIPPWQAYLERELSQQERAWDGEEVVGGDPGREEGGQAALKGDLERGECLEAWLVGRGW